MTDPFELLRRDISELGRLLGDTLVEQEGTQLFELEESVRALAKERRKHDRRGTAAKRMREAVEALDAPTAARVARAFTHYFQLVNLAEQHHRARRLRDYARAQEPQPGSLAHELARVNARAGAVDLEAVRAAGHWEALEDWKRTLPRICCDEAARTGRPVPAVWDFTGYSLRAASRFRKRAPRATCGGTSTAPTSTIIWANSF